MRRVYRACPLGYLNDYRTRKIMVHRERAPGVKKAFGRYATGETMLDELRAFFAGRGIKTRTGKVSGRKPTTQILKNPRHYGLSRHGGEVHEGKHSLIITHAAFDALQAVSGRRMRWRRSDKVTPPQAVAGLPEPSGPLGCSRVSCAKLERRLRKRLPPQR